MKTIELDMYQATAVAALVLLLGRILVAKISISFMQLFIPS